MPTRTDLQNLALLRIKEAQTLLDNDLSEGAFYLAGYTIELSLKSAICKNFEIDELFQDPESANKTKEISEAFNKLKVHDLNTLIVFAGLYQKLKDKNEQIFESWSIIGQMKWNENCRYVPIGTNMEARCCY